MNVIIKAPYLLVTSFEEIKLARVFKNLDDAIDAWADSWGMSYVQRAKLENNLFDENWEVDENDDAFRIRRDGFGGSYCELVRLKE